MPLHRLRPAHGTRRRVLLGAAAAAVVLGTVIAVVGLRPGVDPEAAGVAAPLTTRAVPTAVPPVAPAAAAPSTTGTTTTTTSSTSTTTTSTSSATSTSSRTATASAAGGGGATGRVLALVNAERADAGCGPVERSGTLARAASDYAALMARTGTFSHTGPDGSDFADRARAAGYDDPAAENIARGQDSADEVMAGWMDSSGHRRNILDCSFTTLGVGHADDGDVWVQVFGR